MCLLRVGYSKHAIVKPEKEIARTKGLVDKTMRKVTEATKLVSEELDGMFCICKKTTVTYQGKITNKTWVNLILI